MNKYKSVFFLLAFISLPLSIMGQTSAQRSKILILKDGQEIRADSVKIDQLECELSFVSPGKWVRQSICIGFAQFYYDARGGVRNFDERPCTCEKVTYIVKAITNTPKSTSDLIILTKGDDLIADVGTVKIDTKKLIINYFKNKKKQKVKYCEAKEIRFADGKVEAIDQSLCKPKK
jgi:hypothetical protein